MDIDSAQQYSVVILVFEKAASLMLVFWLGIDLPSCI